MRQHTGWKGAAAALLALLLAAGAAAEEWPEETLHDAGGKSYKQVHTGDGGVEVWELVGIFGSAEEALESIGFEQEPKDKGPGKAEINSWSYDVTIRQTAEQKEPGMTVKLAETEETGKETDNGPALRASKAFRRSRGTKGSRLRITVKPSWETGSAEAAKEEGISARERKRKRVKRKAKRMLSEILEEAPGPWNQIYLQDNRGSGR